MLDKKIQSGSTDSTNNYIYNGRVQAYEVAISELEELIKASFINR